MVSRWSRISASRTASSEYARQGCLRVNQSAEGPDNARMKGRPASRYMLDTIPAHACGMQTAGSGDRHFPRRDTVALSDGGSDRDHQAN